MTQTPTNPPAGWYPQDNQERWWDGNAWSDNVRPLGSEPVPPTQPYAQPYAQPAYGQPAYLQAPVQKSHTARNILIVFGVLFVLFVGGCVAVVAVIGSKVDEAVNDETLGGPNKPLTLTEGQAFDVAGFEYASGWSIGHDPVGNTVSVDDLKVTNNRGEADRLLAEIKLLSNNEVVATATCTAGSLDKIAEDTTVTVECTSADTFPPAYDEVTIQDSF